MIRKEKLHLSVLAIFLLPLLFGCQFDEDAGYLPKTRSMYFSYKDSMNEGTHILRIEEEDIDRNWEEKWGIAPVDLGDMQAYEQELWVSDVNKNEIIEIDASSGLIKTKHSLQLITPHHLSIGKSYLLISDTLQQIIGFWDKKQNDLKTYQLTSQPSFAVYRSQKFFIVYNKTEVLIYHEKALVPIDSLDFQYPIEDIHIDNGLYSIVFGKDGDQRYQGFIDYNTNSFITPPEPTEIIKARYTPFSRQVYGREFLVDHLLKIDRKISFIVNIQDFEADFFEGNMYFIRNDSLSVFNHWNRKTDQIIPFNGQLISSYFFVE